MNALEKLRAAQKRWRLRIDAEFAHEFDRYDSEQAILRDCADELDPIIEEFERERGAERILALKQCFELWKLSHEDFGAEIQGFIRQEEKALATCAGGAQ